MMNAELHLSLAGLMTMVCGTPPQGGPSTYVDSLRGVKLEYPASWTVEELADRDVLLQLSPVQEADWQTNIFIELRRDLETSLPREERLRTLADNLDREKAGFALQSSRRYSRT